MSKQLSPADRSLIALAWPIFVEQALHMSTGAVDTFMVSHISDNAVAALGTANGLRSHPQSNGCLTVYGSGCLGVKKPARGGLVEVAGLAPELRFRRSGNAGRHPKTRRRACGFSNPMN